MTPDPEPALAGDDIQGNIVPGFFKPHVSVLALEITDSRSARQWCTAVAPNITTLSQAMATKRRVRALEAERAAAKLSAFDGDGSQVALRAVLSDVDDAWTSVAFSRHALELLLGDARGDLDQFTDQAFHLGMTTRSASLGDPPDSTDEWVVRDPDVLLVLAADLDDTLIALEAAMTELAEAHGLRVVYREDGHKLDAIGSEHFGFQDGVSQPGVRGLLDGVPITPRHVRDRADQRPESWLYGLPGQYLVWPGEFVFGYPGHGSDPLLAGAVKQPGPAWSRNGSYLVFRRLRQDVAAFREFIADNARRLKPRGISEEQLAAYVVGRWPSGAPVARAPKADVPALGVDRLRNDYFEFGAPTRTLELDDGGSTNGHPEAVADPVGLVCPMFAHIRKVNTRTAANDAGGRMGSFDRRILRRGIPFGPPYALDPAAERGLLFLSCQTSIADQFEFLNRQWMGDHANPRSPGGHDLLIGQNGQPGEYRVRRGDLVSADSATVTALQDFVIPTGGGYFFTPSLTALRTVLSGGRT